MKVLVAEDTPTQAAMVKLALQRLGHEVVLARDGIDAIEKAYLERPDLIVSDVVMPRLNGYQVCRLLKDDRQTSSIPVVLLTSLEERQDMFWGLKSGADKYVTKGGDIPGLVREIQDFLEDWYRDREPVARKEGSEAGGLGFDVMERVIRLLERNLFESTVVSEIQNLVNTLDDYGKTISSVLEILSRVIDYHAGCILLLGEESSELHFLVNRPVGENFLDELAKRAAESIAARTGTIATDGAVREVHDPQGVLQGGGEPDVEVRSLRTWPLRTKGRPSGVIALAAAEEGVFTERTEQIFEIIAMQANIVIDYAGLYERTKQLSITDGLTKVYNHRYFQEQLLREFSRAQRQNSVLSLVLLDIDHFKKFNDTYGHQQGDTVLKELGKVLQSSIRSCDILARYGGEEFAIIMPDTELAICAKAAERLRKTVESHAVPGQEQILKVTISMGVATVPHPEGAIESPSELISAADQALYRAKENGRNRVEC